METHLNKVLFRYKTMKITLKVQCEMCKKVELTRNIDIRDPIQPIKTFYCIEKFTKYVCDDCVEKFDKNKVYFYEKNGQKYVDLRSPVLRNKVIN